MQLRAAALAAALCAATEAHNCTPGSDGKCADVCDACCKSYIPAGDPCEQCVKQSCPAPPPVPPPPPTPAPNVCNATAGTPCNVCAACCQPYIPNGPSCDQCAQKECACSTDGCLTNQTATCCNAGGFKHVSTYCDPVKPYVLGMRCDDVAPGPGGCVPKGICIQDRSQSCCEGLSATFSQSCPNYDHPDALPCILSGDCKLCK